MFREAENCMDDVASRWFQVSTLHHAAIGLHVARGRQKLDPDLRREDGDAVGDCHAGASRYPGDTLRVPARQAGFSIVSAIFLLVVLSALGAFIVSISSGQHTASMLDVQGARAYQAARAGIEWGAYQVLDPNSGAASATPVACPATTTLTPFAGFSTSVSCVLSTHTESGNNIGVYRFTSTSSSGTMGTSNYVSRVVVATVAKCLNPAAAAPFSCT